VISARLCHQFPAAESGAGWKLEIDLLARAGIIFLFGPSDCGAREVLRAIAGLFACEEGRILVDDRLVYDAAAAVDLPARERRCAYIRGTRAGLFPHLTVRENIAFVASGAGGLGKHRNADSVVKQFGLEEIENKRPDELGLGECWRVGVARAAAAESRAVLMELPGLSLSPDARGQIERVVRLLRRHFEGPVILFGEDGELLFTMADHACIMDRGRVLQQGTPAAIVDAPAGREVLQMLGDFQFFEAEIVQLDPQRNSSLLRMLGAEWQGPYLRGHFRGDRVQLWARASELRLTRGERGHRGAGSGVAVEVERAVRVAGGVRLELGNGLGIVLPQDRVDLRQDNGWWLEIPPEALHAF
jgi:molybdate transport system ATP-binding protein